MTTIVDFEAKSISGQDFDFSALAGKIVLVVNVASACGYTKQYAELEALYQKYKDQGLVLLGFPCNQFGGQESGTDAEISDFCQVNFGVTFPMFSKVKVNSAEAHPLFIWLKETSKDGHNTRVAWNFEKFLVGRDGLCEKRFAKGVVPDDIAADIEKLL